MLVLLVKFGNEVRPPFRRPVGDGAKRADPVGLSGSTDFPAQTGAAGIAALGTRH